MSIKDNKKDRTPKRPICFLFVVKEILYSSYDESCKDKSDNAPEDSAADHIREHKVVAVEECLHTLDGIELFLRLNYVAEPHTKEGHSCTDDSGHGELYSQ